ncbi:hypothetical protein CRG98_021932 [Punica granatum]|uniref:Uncharacterized protein n=1 Tax=Punica granatum TaxID=22663 RepID=A0A2I0JMU3_PUNGR|nr:hypothetical protein CRG98_021932 [Punica granatum]
MSGSRWRGNQTDGQGCFALSRIPLKRCDLKGANKEPEAVESPEGKKQKRVAIVGLRSSLGLDKQKQEAVADTPKKRNKPSGTMFTGRSIQTHQLCKCTEEAISREPESVAGDVVGNPSKNKTEESHYLLFMHPSRPY